uniref:Uncharacterized protein n=1 Tax=Arundo donax TaxID=35708 RepID=A0A0A8Z3C9_ARUDO
MDIYFTVVFGNSCWRKFNSH